MKKRLVLCVVVCIMLASGSFPVLADDSIPAVWNLTFETDDVLVAAKEAFLVFLGSGYWEKAEMQTVGCVVLDQQETDDQIVLSLYTARSVFDVSSGEPTRIAGGRRPVKITFAKEGGAYRLLSFQQPEDGDANGTSKIDIFGETLGTDIMKNQTQYGELAQQDAFAEADAYLRFLETGVKEGTWLEFLKNGSEKDAEKIIREAVSGIYPYYNGQVTTYPYDRHLYTIIVEGEQSYSGILTFTCHNDSGEQMAYFKVQVKDGALQLLDGEMPQ